MFGTGAILDTATNAQILTWSAVIVAVSSAVVIAVIVGPYKIRGVSRRKGSPDRATEIKAIRTAARLHVALAMRVSSNESKVTDIDDAIRAIQVKTAEIADRIGDAEKRSIVIMGMLEQLTRATCQSEKRTPDV